MVYLKSFLAGIVALILSVFLIPIGLGIFFTVGRILRPTAMTGGEIGWDLRSFFATSIIPWIVVITIFCLGFYWEFRRASRAS